MSDDRFATARRFFEAWFADVIGAPGYPTHVICIWCAPLRVSYFEPTIDEAASRAISLADQNQNVYFGVCSMDSPPKKGRGEEHRITTVPGVWADIDIQSGSIHKKKVAPSEQAAREVLEKLGLPPSLLVHSGHGLQAYWKLSEPIRIVNDQQRQDAKKLVRNWERTIRALANRAGWTIDHTHDLTRVFRVPGTVNLKADPISVRFLVPEEGSQVHRYLVEQVTDNMIPEALTPESQTSKVIVHQEIDYDIKLRTDVAFPPVVAYLTKNDPMFARTIEKRRNDFKEDTSQSRYDFELVRLMGMAGCSQQDIWDTLYAWRQMKGEHPDKMLRRSYWMPTIAKGLAAARQDLAEKTIGELMESVGMANDATSQREPETYPDQQTAGDAHIAGEKQEAPEAAAPTGPPLVTIGTERAKAKDRIRHITDDQRTQCCRAVSNAIGIEIVQVIQQGIDDAIYSLILADRTDVRIGSAKQLHNQDHVRIRINEVAHINFERIRDQTWDQHADGMVTFATLVEDPEKDRASSILDWLGLYCGEGIPVVTKGSDEWRQQVAYGDAFICENKLFLVNTSFMSWVNRERLAGEPIKKRDWDDRMRVAGFVCCKKPFFARERGMRVGRRYWYIDLDKVPEVGGAPEADQKGQPGHEGNRILQGPWEAESGSASN